MKELSKSNEIGNIQKIRNMSLISTLSKATDFTFQVVYRRKTNMYLKKTEENVSQH